MEFDFNDSGLSDGMYKLAGNFTAAQHCPPSLYGDATLIHCGYAQIVLQQNDIMWFRSSNWNRTVWNKWSKTGTATKPEEHALPIAASISPSPCYYFKTQEGIVHVYMRFVVQSGIPNGSVIASLPLGFHPVAYMEAPLLNNRGTVNAGINRNGSIVLYNSSILQVGDICSVVMPSFIPAN